MLKTENELKRWSILDRFTGKIIGITDNEFSEGLENNMIELRGRFVTDKFNRKMWIDGILKNKKRI